jgi:hypothetical protein
MYSCDLFAHTCMVPWEYQELAFVQCVVSKMDANQIFSLKQSLGVMNITDIPTLANYTYSALESNNSDCVGSKRRFCDGF